MLMIKENRFGAAVMDCYAYYTTNINKLGSRRPAGARLKGTGGMLTSGKLLAIAASLLMMAGAATTAFAANSCVQSNGHVSTNCTLDMDYYGTISIENQSNPITLDCGGHSIEGPDAGPDPVGIAIKNAAHITVQNCTIKYFGTGVKVDSSDDIKLLNNKITYNEGDGIDLNSSSHIIIQGGTVDFNADEGIDIDQSSTVGIYHVTVNSNGKATSMGGDGINSNYSQNVWIMYCNISSNKGRGIDIMAGSNLTVGVEYNTFSGNKKGPYRCDVEPCPSNVIIKYNTTL
jgi:parallel beta-helix repeat protein